MSHEKKRRLAEATDSTIPAKRIKKIEDDGANGTPNDNSEPEVKKQKKEKTEKKDKKDKKDKKKKRDRDGKKQKKNRDRKGLVEQEEEAAVEDASGGDGVHPENTNTYTYQQTAALTALPGSDIKDFLRKEQITITDPASTAPSTPLRPILQFAQIPPSALLEHSPFAGFTTPTPIQSASWPHSLSGRDVIGVAETGSGKTLAFAMPCIEALYGRQRPERSRGKVARAMAVIVSPTRELAMQTHASLAPLAKLVGLSSVCVYGGASKDEQKSLLLKKKGGADIIVATPGRLKDFLADGTINLEEAQFVVLDEADRMLDKGFDEDIKKIIGQCPAKEQRQTLMFTATWPASVRALAEGYMVDPVKITIGGKTRAGESDSEGGGGGTIELQANSRIAQTVEVIDPREKEWRLLRLLKDAQQGKGKNDRVLVFCLYKKEATRVEGFLQKKGVNVASIHGDLKQDQRTRALEAFKAGTTSVLVATDVAARGLDIPEVKLVINVTFPLTIEDYVHRIGRTGRAGKTGQAITLFTEHDKTHSGSLINILKAANQPVPDELFKFGTTVKKKGHDTYGAFFKDVDMSRKGTKITFD